MYSVSVFCKGLPLFKPLVKGYPLLRYWEISLVHAKASHGVDELESEENAQADENYCENLCWNVQNILDCKQHNQWKQASIQWPFYWNK